MPSERLCVSFSKQIYVGLLAGVALGLFLGERAAVFGIAATAFVKLLQVTVLPYMTVSLVSNLGRLDYEQARLLALRAGSILLCLWGIALVLASLFPLAFPTVETARFFSTTVVEPPATFDFINLYIPSNPFFSLANNIVPAVVLFSALLGVALIGMENKAVVLDMLGAAATLLSRATKMITRLTPYGLFAIAANAAGTLDLTQLGRLQVYLIVYSAAALFLSLWLLPGLVAALTPVKAREVLARCRDAFVTAFAVSDLFIVLPMLIEATKDLLERHDVGGEKRRTLPDVVVSASFNFPSAGKLMSLSFLLFAAWFADTPIDAARYPQLAVTGLLTFFGSLNAAVPFLLDVFRVPADTFQLFLATGVVNSHFGALAAASHTVALALLATVAMAGKLRLDVVRLFRFCVVTVVLAAVLFGGSRLLFESLLQPTYEQRGVLLSMQLRTKAPDAVVLREPGPAPAHESGTTLERIHARGTLRVGYFPDALPFAFFNDAGDLVGYDVELAHTLARDLRVRLELVPIDRGQIVEAVDTRTVDVVMAGVAITTERIAQLSFSAPYLDETLAFIVPDHRRAEFADWETLRGRADLKLAAPDLPYYTDLIRRLLPRAEIDVLPDVEAAMRAGVIDADAIVAAAERGSAWTLLYPAFTVVVPQPGLVKIPLGYPLIREEAWRNFVDQWLELKRKDGTLDELYSYWILGRDAAEKRRRWSILDHLLLGAGARDE
jgi:Na+/H+-dicarboxylate symporter/ABC-type amino acid transport substrate-binding protein